MQLNLSHGICSLKIQTAACSWWHYAPDSCTFFFLHLHSITLPRIKDRLSRWQMPGSLPTPTSHSEGWDHIISARIHSPGSSVRLLKERSNCLIQIHQLMQKIRWRGGKWGEERPRTIPHSWPLRLWSGISP